MPAPRSFISPDDFSKTSTSQPRLRRAMALNSPPSEPPTTTTFGAVPFPFNMTAPLPARSCRRSLVAGSRSGPGLLEGVEEGARFPRPGQSDGVVDEEERHALHPGTAGLFFRRPDRRQSLVAAQDGLGPAPVQPCLGHHVEQDGRLADVPALDEVRPEDRLHHGVLHALRVGESDQAVGVECVGSSHDLVEGERDALAPARLGHLGVKGQRPLPASELGGAVLLAVHPSLGHSRVELKRMPPHPHLFSPEGGDGLLQPPLADIAPRANHVRDHVYGQRHDQLSFMKIWIRTFLPVS